MNKIFPLFLLLSTATIAQQGRIGVRLDYASVFGFENSTNTSSFGGSLSFGFRTSGFGLDFKPGIKLGRYYIGLDFGLLSKYYILSKTSHFLISLNFHSNGATGGHSVASSSISFLLIGIGYGFELDENKSLGLIAYINPGGNNIGRSRNWGYNEHGYFTYIYKNYDADLIIEASLGIDIIFGTRSGN